MHGARSPVAVSITVDTGPEVEEDEHEEMQWMVSASMHNDISSL